MKSAVNTPTGKEIKRDKPVIYKVYKMIKPIPYKLDLNASPSNHWFPVKKW